MSEAAPDDLFSRLAAALEQVPRDIEVRADLEQVIVKSGVPGGRSTLALVLSSSQTIMFYSVWPDPVPEPDRQACCDFVARANTGLSPATLEFDADTGILAARSGIHFSDVDLIDELPPTAFVRLLWLCILDVEELAAKSGRSFPGG
ncbi:MAG: YbjN domain-containing protein [Actinomycetota bacterium]|nr:YbjN domain-containing protein [Actinomycetota bacterium]